MAIGNYKSWEVAKVIGGSGTGGLLVRQGQDCSLKVRFASRIGAIYINSELMLELWQRHGALGMPRPFRGPALCEGAGA